MPFGLVYQGQQEVIGSQLGEGKVHRGTFHKRPAAIKLYQDGDKAFDNQMQVFDALNGTPHPNVIELLGVWPERGGGPMCLATGLCDCSLEALLYPESKLPPPPSSFDVALIGSDTIPGAHRVPAMQHVSLQFVLSAAIQMAQGIACLHPRQLHLNLKPSNVLVTALTTEQASSDPGNSTESLARALYTRMAAENSSDKSAARNVHIRQAAKLAGVPLQLKIADFGLPHNKGSEPEGWPAASLPYLAPEVIQGGVTSASPAADTYALGVLLWEMLHRKKPFHDLTPKEITCVCGLLDAALKVAYKGSASMRIPDAAANTALPETPPFLLAAHMQVVARKLLVGGGLSWDTAQHLQPAAVRQLVTTCLHPDPKQRPTASSLVHQLGMLQLELLGAARTHMANRIIQAYTTSARTEALQGLRGQQLVLNRYGIPDWRHQHCSLLMLQPGMTYQSQLGVPGQQPSQAHYQDHQQQQQVEEQRC